MATRECVRPGCNSYMCSRKSTEFGYICYDCFDELALLGPTADVAEFMQTKPHRVRAGASVAYFNEVFPRLTLRHDDD